MRQSAARFYGRTRNLRATPAYPIVLNRNGGIRPPIFSFILGATPLDQQTQASIVSGTRAGELLTTPNVVAGNYFPASNCTGGVSMVARLTSGATLTTLMGKPFAATHTDPYFDYGIFYYDAASVECRIGSITQTFSVATDAEHATTIAFTADGVNWNFYVDGLLVSSVANTGLPSNTNSQPIRVGTNAEAGEAFTGGIHYAYVFDYALTGGQVMALNVEPFSVFKPISGASLVTASAAADTTPPAFTVGPGVTPNASGGTATGTIDETGSIFMVVVADGAAAPSSTQVIAGQNASGAAALATASATTTTTINAGFSGLSASTAYDAYFVARDDEGTPNVQASPTLVNFTTSASSSATAYYYMQNQ
jgi:hypothetical protein